ncbi:MAG: hypothetical protein AB1607_07420 [Chloroflexota bacterium]
MSDMNEQMPAEPKKNNNTIIIAVVVVLLLCCCCSAAFGLWTYGDAIMEALNF